MANWNKLSSRGRVEDRRGFGPSAIGGVSITGVAILLLVNYLSGGDISDVITQLDSLPAQTQTADDQSTFAGADEYEVFAATVLGSTNDLWEGIFSSQSKTYTEPTLVLFRGATESACGAATSQVGPHYCPVNKTIYLDETFFDELQYRFGARGGDVAEAYVIAHEVAHHVQNELGTLGMQRSNDDSIKTELQADCYAGLWANSIRHLDVFSEGEILEALDAAAAVGDDRIQERVTGYVNPENWTHGSSEQRVQWFSKGYESGDFSQCSVD
ncbi:MAG: neutral zinc metallopeptidase [bacterium]|nr:neutral zinc metallopeptidase [bacterium]